MMFHQPRQCPENGFSHRWAKFAASATASEIFAFLKPERTSILESLKWEDAETTKQLIWIKITVFKRNNRTHDVEVNNQ